MQWFAENPVGFQFMRWYKNFKFLYNMKKLNIVIDFESQSMDVSVNDARECVTNAATVEEMLANEVFAFRPVKTSHYVVLHYADIVCVKASNNSSVFHMADGSSFTVGKKLEVVEKFLSGAPCGGFVRVNRSAIANMRRIKEYEGNTLKLRPHSSLTIGQNSREVCHELLSSIRVLK